MLPTVGFRLEIAPESQGQPDDPVHGRELHLRSRRVRLGWVPAIVGTTSVITDIFIPNASVESQLLKCQFDIDWANTLDRGLRTDVIYLYNI